MRRLHECFHLEIVFLLEQGVIEIDVGFEHLGHRRLFENRLPWTFRFAGAAIDTFIRIDIEHVGEFDLIVANVFVDAIDRAHTDASGVHAIDAKSGDRPRHGYYPLLMRFQGASGKRVFLSYTDRQMMKSSERNKASHDRNLKYNRDGLRRRKEAQAA